MLYLHDGQNVFSFAGTNICFGWGSWELDKTVDEQCGAKKMQEIILVGVDNSPARFQEYCGQHAGTNNPTPFENYTSFLIRELKPKIDSDYRTRPEPEHTGVMGSSLGGICSMVLAWDRPEVFGRAASLSGAFQVDQTNFLNQVLRRYARAYALVRLRRPEQARAAVGDLLEVAADAVDPDVQAIAAFDAGAIALMQDRPPEAIDHLERALAHRGGRLQRPLGRMYLAEAYLGAGDVERAAGALARVPFEPVGPADMPATLVPRLCRLQGLIAAARGDRDLADRRLAEAEAGWDRLLGRVDIGSAYATVVVDLGRPPVGGLVEVAQELACVRAERRHVASTDDPGRLPVGSRR